MALTAALDITAFIAVTEIADLTEVTVSIIAAVITRRV